MCSSSVSEMQADEAAVSQVTLSPDTPGRLINCSYFTTLGCSLLRRHDVGMVFPVWVRFLGMLQAGGQSHCTSRLVLCRSGMLGGHQLPLLSQDITTGMPFLGTEQSPATLPSRQSRIPHRGPLLSPRSHPSDHPLFPGNLHLFPPAAFS